MYRLCFFFSSRRRHTRCGRDWSSDVCSSDLAAEAAAAAEVAGLRAGTARVADLRARPRGRTDQGRMRPRFVEITRRDALKRAGILAAAVGALEAAGPLAFVPERALAAASPSDIQFDIAKFLAVPPQTYGSGVK